MQKIDIEFVTNGIFGIKREEQEKTFIKLTKKELVRCLMHAISITI